VFPETTDFANCVPGREGLNIRNPPQNLEVHSLIVLVEKSGVNSGRLTTCASAANAGTDLSGAFAVLQGQYRERPAGAIPYAGVRQQQALVMPLLRQHLNACRNPSASRSSSDVAGSPVTSSLWAAQAPAVARRS
jgi:hypothetical protein